MILRWCQERQARSKRPSRLRNASCPAWLQTRSGWRGGHWFLKACFAFSLVLGTRFCPNMAAATIGKLTIGTASFEVVISDLLYEPVACIVNAANGGLSHGGGVAAAILKAAGSRFDRECQLLVHAYGRIPIGGAVVTTAGQLPYKGIIHAVGPRLGNGDEENKLVQTLKNSFLRAHERGWKSLAFPAISSGIYAVPYEHLRPSLRPCRAGVLHSASTITSQDHPARTLPGPAGRTRAPGTFPPLGPYPSGLASSPAGHPHTKRHR